MDFYNTSKDSKQIPHGSPMKYDSSKNLNDYDIINFAYEDERYHIYTYDIVDTNKSKCIPVYIIKDSLYVGIPKENETPDFIGFAVLDDGLRSNTAGGMHNYDSKNQNTNNTTIPDNQNNDSQIIIVEDSNINNENLKTDNNTTQTIEKTGVPIAILISAILLSIIGFRRKK